jgi:hypothetical protein
MVGLARYSKQFRSLFCCVKVYGLESSTIKGISQMTVAYTTAVTRFQQHPLTNMQEMHVQRLRLPLSAIWRSWTCSKTTARTLENKDKIDFPKILLKPNFTKQHSNQHSRRMHSWEPKQTLVYRVQAGCHEQQTQSNSIFGVKHTKALLQ